MRIQLTTLGDGTILVKTTTSGFGGAHKRGSTVRPGGSYLGKSYDELQRVAASCGEYEFTASAPPDQVRLKRARRT